MPQSYQPAYSDSWLMVNLGTESEVGSFLHRPGKPGHSVVGKQVPAGQWISPEELKNGDVLVVRTRDQIAIISNGSVRLPQDQNDVVLLDGEEKTRISKGAQLTTVLGDTHPQTVEEVVLVSGSPYLTSEARRAIDHPILKDFARVHRYGRPGENVWRHLDAGRRIVGKPVLIDGNVMGQALVGTLSNLGPVKFRFGGGSNYGGLIYTQNSVYRYDNKGKIRQAFTIDGANRMTGHTTFGLAQVEKSAESLQEFTVTLVAGQRVAFAGSSRTSPTEAIVTDLQLMSADEAFKVTGGDRLPASYQDIDTAQIVAAPTLGSHFGGLGGR